MKSTSSNSFIIATLLYSALLLAGYWLFSLELKNEIPLEKTRVLPVSLNMFQPVTAESTPTEAKPVIAPIEESAEPKVEPIEAVESKAPLPVEAPVKPPIEPVPSEPLPKPEPIIEKKPTPTPMPEPIVVKPLAKAAPTLTTEPSPPVTQPKSEAQPITPKPIAPQVSAQQRASAEQAYLADLRNEILLHAQDTYPRQAKRRQWEGVVTLSFTLLPSGKIVGVTIQDSSGRQVLDNAAMSIVQRKMRNQFQEFPPEINRKEWKITIPVSYNFR